MIHADEKFTIVYFKDEKWHETLIAVDTISEAEKEQTALVKMGYPAVWYRVGVLKEMGLPKKAPDKDWWKYFRATIHARSVEEGLA